MQGGTVAVVGGSIGGCAAALAAYRGGAERVTVFERTGGRLRDRGVGITVHQDRFEELEAAGYASVRTPCVPLSRRVWTVRDGGSEHGRRLAAHPFPFRAYTWAALWSDLRRRVPQRVVYRSGTTVCGVEPDGDGVTLHFEGGDQERFDVVVGADGYRSVVRDAMFADLAPEYAGYLAWRGTSGAEPAPTSGEAEACTVVFPNGHCMLYPIPAPAGGHRCNWVLYTSPPDRLHPDLRRPTSLPPGRLASELTAYLRACVAEWFPPHWASRVLSTPAENTFIQPLYDLVAPHYAVGRLFLVGDAASVARPHTGGGSVKALQDAVALENAWRSGDAWQDVAAGYGTGRRAVGAEMVALGRRLGRDQVEQTPDWHGIGEAEFDAWWREQHGGSDRRSGFGGHAMNRG